MNSQIRDWIAVALPGVWFITLLDALIPIYFHRPREIAGYFAALAFAREPVRSFFYLTPAESYASLHLHSFLSAPLLALGYHEGGRLVSLLATIATALILYQFVNELTGKRFAGLVAGFGFWVIPFTQRFAYAFQPEALSIALTTAVVYLTHRYITVKDAWAFHGSLVVLVCAILTHR